MHKKLEAELVSLAHSILQMKNKEDVNALHKKAHDIYEKLSVLKFVDHYLATTPNVTENKEDIIDRMKEKQSEPKQLEEEVLSEPLKEHTEETIDVVEENVEAVVEEIPELEFDSPESNATNAATGEEEESSEEMDQSIDLEMPDVEDSEDEPAPEPAPTDLFQTTLEEELKDAISADVATELFEKATKEDPVVDTEKVAEKRSLNDALFKHNLQIGLNDRIAFVKNLFGGSQEDFNRVVSQLNSFKTEKEAKTFINKHVKPDYDWTDKETYEERLMDIIERKYL